MICGPHFCKNFIGHKRTDDFGSTQNVRITHEETEVDLFFCFLSKDGGNSRDAVRL